MFYMRKRRWVRMPSLLRERGVRATTFPFVCHNAPAGVLGNHRVRQFMVTKPR